MNLIFYTYYYDNSNICIIPPPSIKYKSYYFTSNLTTYDALGDTSWNRVLDISLNLSYIDPMVYELYKLEFGLPVVPVVYEKFILRWYSRPKMTQYSILDNPQYYVDLSAADYLCVINYKTYTIDEKYIENFILKHLKMPDFCLLYKRFNNDMEILIKNVRHKDIDERMAFLKQILTEDKDTYII